MRFFLIVGGVLVGGGLWVGYAWLRYRWRAPFEEAIPPYKRVLQAERRDRIWNGDEWK